MPTKPMNPKDRIQRASVLTGDGCWEWSLQRDRVGYGRLKVQLGSRAAFRFTSAHRYAYEVYVGPIPQGMNILHKCDNRACCNPEHLFVGTQGDNMRDMHAKGRGPNGYKRDAEVCRQNAARKEKP